jgi:LysR family transcriptional regulator, benzoate and cis,cis-muconate-responsive activator of ben and cat genes
MRMDRKLDISLKTQKFITTAALMGSFHRAAKSLGVDHSVIVRNINQLERDLGVRIFDRNRSHFAVTSAGRVFIREIMQAIERAERACDLARYHAQIERGPLRIGYSAYIHSRLVPILERWWSSASNVELKKQMPDDPLRALTESRTELCSASTRQVVDLVSRGALHAGFGIQPIEDENLIVHPVVRETFCLAVSKNHHFAKQTSIFIRDLDGAIVFFLPRTAHTAFYDQTMEYIDSTGAKPVMREVLSLTHVLEIVAHNFGVALLPRSASQVSHLGVIFKPIADKLLWIETAFFQRFDQQDERIVSFMNELLSHLRRSPLNQ